MKRVIAILFLLSVSSNAATTFMYDGGDSTRDDSFPWTVKTGAATIDTTTPITGAASLKMDCTGLITYRMNGVYADAGRRTTFRFKMSAIPSGSVGIMAVQTSGANNIFVLNVTSAGKLMIVPTGANAGTTGTTVLNTSTPYRIALSYTITSSTVFAAKVYLNGKLEATATVSGTLTTTSSNRILIGNGTAFGAGQFVWFDDIFIDDGATLDDPGNIIVTAKRPNANGAANAWTTQIGSGGSGYGTGHSPQVNEQPLSTTNGWSIASASLLTEEYTIEGAATGNIDVSNPRYKLIDYMGWVYAKVGSAGTRNIIVNGSASNVSLTTTATQFTKIAGSSTYPSGNTAIGMNNNSVNNLTSLYECGILLAYKLPRRVSVTP